MSTTGISRTTPQLFRDCLRLVDHIAGKSIKGQKLRGIIGKEFRKNANIKDPAMIEGLKAGAIRGLSNYLMMESSKKDERFRNQISNYTDSATSSIASTDQTKSSDK